MKYKKTNVGRLLVNILSQIIPVMIGVYLGFALNNYGISRKSKADQAILATMINDEIVKNHTEIKSGYLITMNSRIHLLPSYKKRAF